MVGGLLLLGYAGEGSGVAFQLPFVFQDVLPFIGSDCRDVWVS